MFNITREKSLFEHRAGNYPQNILLSSKIISCVKYSFLTAFFLYNSISQVTAQPQDSQLLRTLSIADYAQIFETIFLVIGIGITVFFSFLTLRNSKRSLTATALKDFSVEISEKYSHLTTKFGGRLGSKPIPLDTIKDVSKEIDGYQAIRDYLNAYEGLARNINLGIYDFQVAKSSRKTSIANAYRRFCNLIAERRRMGSKSWQHLEKLGRRWASDAPETEE